MVNKIMSLREAVSHFVKNGASVFLSGAQHGEPSAAIHEMIRQDVQDLTIVSTLTHTLPLLIGSGQVARIITAFLHQNEKTEYAVARAKKLGKMPRVEEYSHQSLCLALLAGQINVPFLPTRVLLGSDIVKHNDGLGTVICPFSGERLTAVQAVHPEICILHTQRADRMGNAQKWGSLGLDIEGAGASKTIIVTTEEIVDPDVIRREPNLTIVPGFRVAAVVHQPWGAYPMHLAGCYNGDVAGFEREIRNPEGFERYLAELVLGVSTWEEYLKKVEKIKGPAYFSGIKIQNILSGDPIQTGY